MTQPIHVLTIDDDQDVLAIISLSLKLDPAFAVQSACDPDVALHGLSDGTLPDIILIDYHMPARTGDQVAQDIRRIPDCRSIPIIFLTATVDRDTKERMMAAGAVGVIEKPFDPVTLTTRIRGLAGC